jgi:hypothetical protein
MPRHDYRWLIVTLANLVLWWLVGLANHYLGGTFAIYLYIGGLFVAYGALRLDPKHGLVATILTALMMDAVEPVPFGTSLFLFTIVHVTVLYGRHRFPREGAVFAVVVALLANLFLVIALSFLLVGANPRPGNAWLRIFTDLLYSQAVIAFIAPWFIALQDRMMEQAGIHPETGRLVHR